MHVFEMQFNGNERGKKGDVLRESEKEKSDRDDDYYTFRSSVDGARFFLDSGGRGKPQKQIVFQSIRFFASPLERYYEVSRGI